MSHYNFGFELLGSLVERHFNVPNAFDNLNVNLFINTQDKKNGSHTITIHGQPIFIPTQEVSFTRSFYISARRNVRMDEQYASRTLLASLKGISPTSGHLAYDSHVRLDYYHTRINEYINLFKDGDISASTFSMLRYQLQKATKLQLSVIGQNLSEFKPFGRPITAQKAKAYSIKEGAPLSPNAFNTRKTTNSLAQTFRIMGTGIVVVSVATSVFK